MFSKSKWAENKSIQLQSSTYYLAFKKGTDLPYLSIPFS